MVLISDLYGTGPNQAVADHDIVWQDRIFGSLSYVPANPLLAKADSGDDIMAQFLARRFLELTPSALRLGLDLAIVGKLEHFVTRDVFTKTLATDRSIAQIFFNRLVLLLEDNINNYKSLSANKKDSERYKLFSDNLVYAYDLISRLRGLV